LFQYLNQETQKRQAVQKIKNKGLRGAFFENKELRGDSHFQNKGVT
jgi:hypothetical protein